MPGAPLDPAAIRAELELELDWREAEIRFLENVAASLSEIEKAQYRRSLIVLIYAHLEGFCKAALSTYAEHVNQAGCKVVDVDWPIAAASLGMVFKRFRDNDLKSALFRRKLPHDAKLHRFCRERDFLEQLSEFEAQDVDIPVDEVVDTESNLKPVVLKKMLYRLGLDHDLADQWSGELNRLLALRNNIAHGASKRNIQSKEYTELRTTWSTVCHKLMIAIFDAARAQAHLRPPATAAAAAPSP